MTDENKAPTFSRQDFQSLVNTAAAAPLQNLSHSRNVEALLARFSDWYEAVTAPKKAEEIVTPVPVSDPK